LLAEITDEIIADTLFRGVLGGDRLGADGRVRGSRRGLEILKCLFDAGKRLLVL